MVYENQIATATRLIQKYGQACVWREPGADLGTPASPLAGPPTDHNVHIVFLNNTNRRSLASFLSMFGGTDVPTGGLRGLMAAVPFTPTLKGRVSRNTVFVEPSLAIVDENGIDTLNLNGELILYYLGFAR